MTRSPPKTLPFDRPAARALDALVDYCLMLHEGGLDDYPFAPAHVVGRANSLTRRAAERAWTLGTLIVARVADRAPTPDDGALDQAVAALHNETATASRMLAEEFADLRAPAAGKRGKRRARERALECAGTLLSELAIEEFDLAALLATSPSGDQLLLAVPIDPAARVLRSFEPLFHFLELQAESSELLAIERAASAWWFETWSAPPRGPAEAFTRTCREQEFSLVDRVAIALSESVAAATASEPVALALPTRQRALLDALGGSICSVFAVRERRGSIAVLDDLDSGRRFEVLEHNPELEYGKGFVCAGRLLPVAEIGWLRSPGTVLWRPGSRGDDEKILTAALLSAAGDLPRAIAVEAMLSAMVHGQWAPRSIRAAKSREEANVLLSEFNTAMQKEGFAREVEKAELPQGMRVMAKPGMTILEMPIDVTLADWTRALTEQAGASAPSTGGKERPRSSRAEAKAKKANRRKKPN